MVKTQTHRYDCGMIPTLWVYRGIGGNLGFCKQSFRESSGSRISPALLFLKWKDHYFHSLKDLPLMSPAPIFKLFKDRKTFIAKITAWFKISGFATLERSPNNQRLSVSQINTSLLIANPFVMCMLSNLQYLLQYLTYLVMRKIWVQGDWQSRAMTSCECPQSTSW